MKKMYVKVLPILMVLVGMSFSFSSCEKDDEGVNKNDLIGSWNTVKSELTVKKDGKVIYQDDYIDDEGAWIFKKDNTFWIEGDGYTEEIGVWRIKNDKIQIAEDSDWDDIVTLKVLTLNSKNLVLQDEDAFWEDDNGNVYEGNDVVSKIYFEKVK